MILRSLMVSSDDRKIEHFPKTLAGAKAMVRKYARKGIVIEIY